MLCFNCKQEISDAYVKCPHCGADLENNVRVMSKAEQIHYDGVTIESDSDGAAADGNGHQQWNYGGRNGVYIKKVNLNAFGGSWLTKIVITLLIAAIAGFLLFVFLPIALIAIAVGIVIWFILSFFRQ